ncbi:MAG: hypothetical protein EPN21_16630, partial [Methylococcaceae bacterium]
MLRMSEVNAVDHQSMQHMLTAACVDWQGFGRQLACETDALLGGDTSVLLFDESAFAKKGASSGRAWRGNGTDAWAKEQPPTAWQRLVLREGEKGLLAADYLHERVWVWDGREEKARGWHLLVRREAGAEDISHYCLSNAPPDTPLEELARVQSQRFFIEHSFKEAKSECGMADYQVRRWDAWHNHMALVMLGTLFLVKQKMAGRRQW